MILRLSAPVEPKAPPKPHTPSPSSPPAKPARRKTTPGKVPCGDPKPNGPGQPSPGKC